MTDQADKNRVLVLIPAFNEEKSIGGVVRGVIGCGWDCLVIDDGSVDKTVEQAVTAGARVISLATNLGVGAALRTGFKYAIDKGYKRVVQCDADGQHKPELIAELVDCALADDVDLVIGSRFTPAHGVTTFEIATYRKLVMRWLSLMTLIKGHQRLYDTSSGFRCISDPLLSEFAEHFPAHFLGDTFEAHLVALRYGYSVHEIPVQMEKRTHGQSSASTFQATSYILRSVMVALFGLAFTIRPRSVTASSQGSI